MNGTLHIDLTLVATADGSLEVRYRTSTTEALGRVPASVTAAAVAASQPSAAIAAATIVTKVAITEWQARVAQSMMGLLRHPTHSLGLSPLERLAADIERTQPAELRLAIHTEPAPIAASANADVGLLAWEALALALPMPLVSGAGFWRNTHVVRVAGGVSNVRMRTGRTARLFRTWVGTKENVADRLSDSERWSFDGLGGSAVEPALPAAGRLQDLQLPDDATPNVVHVFFHGTLNTAFCYVDEEGVTRDLRDLIQSLAGWGRIDLLVIEACHAGGGHRGEPVLGLASIGVPAVIGPAHAIEWDSAEDWALALYTRIGRGEDVVSANEGARLALGNWGIRSSRLLPRLAFATAAIAANPPRIVEPNLAFPNPYAPAGPHPWRVNRGRDLQRIAEKFTRVHTENPTPNGKRLIAVCGASGAGVRSLVTDVVAHGIPAGCPPQVHTPAPDDDDARAAVDVLATLRRLHPNARLLVAWRSRSLGVLRAAVSGEAEVLPHNVDPPDAAQLEAATPDLMGLLDPGTGAPLAHALANAPAPLLATRVCLSRCFAPETGRVTVASVAAVGGALRAFVAHARAGAAELSDEEWRILVAVARNTLASCSTPLRALGVDDDATRRALTRLCDEADLLVMRRGTDDEAEVLFSFPGLERGWRELNERARPSADPREPQDLRPHGGAERTVLGDVWAIRCRWGDEVLSNPARLAALSGIVAELRRHCAHGRHPWLGQVTLLEQSGGALLVAHPSAPRTTDTPPPGLQLAERYLKARAQALGLGVANTAAVLAPAHLWLNPLAVSDLIGPAVQAPFISPPTPLNPSPDPDLLCLLDYLPHITPGAVGETRHAAVITFAFCEAELPSNPSSVIRGLFKVAQNHVPELLGCDETAAPDPVPTDVSRGISLESTENGWQLVVVLAGRPEGSEGAKDRAATGGVPAGRLGRWLIACVREIELRGLLATIGVAIGDLTLVRVADAHRADRRWFFVGGAKERSRALAAAATVGPPAVERAAWTPLFGWTTLPAPLLDAIPPDDWALVQRELRHEFAAEVDTQARPRSVRSPKGLRPFELLSFDRSRRLFPLNPPRMVADPHTRFEAPKRTDRSRKALENAFRTAIVGPLQLQQWCGTGHAVTEAGWIVSVLLLGLELIGKENTGVTLSVPAVAMTLLLSLLLANAFGAASEYVFGRFVCTRILPVLGPVAIPSMRHAVSLARVPLTLAVEEARLAATFQNRGDGDDWRARLKRGRSTAREILALIESETGPVGVLCWWLYVARLNATVAWAGAPSVGANLPASGLKVTRGTGGMAWLLAALVGAASWARETWRPSRPTTGATASRHARRRAVELDVPVVAFTGGIVGVSCYFTLSVAVFTMVGLTPTGVVTCVATTTLLAFVVSYAYYTRIRMVSFASMAGGSGSWRHEAKGMTFEENLRRVYRGIGLVTALLVGLVVGKLAFGQGSLMLVVLAACAGVFAQAARAVAKYPEGQLRRQLKSTLARLGDDGNAKAPRSPAVLWKNLEDPSRLGTTASTVRALVARGGLLAQSLDLVTRVLAGRGKAAGAEAAHLGAARAELAEAGVFVSDQWGKTHFVGGKVAADLGYGEGAPPPNGVAELYADGHIFASTVARLIAHARPGQVIEVSATGRHRDGAARGAFRLYLQQLRPITDSPLRGSIGVAVPLDRQTRR